MVSGAGQPTKSEAEQKARVEAEAARVRPIAEAAATIEAEDLPVKIVGVDLVLASAGTEREYDCLHLVEASLTNWQPDGQFDLITCVHGLHYIGDKHGSKSSGERAWGFSTG